MINTSKKFAFIILHYLNYEITRECTDAIQKTIKNDTYDIVIVDNGSNNGSGEKLKMLYHKNKKIHVLIEKENRGFAKGNNIGYLYAKQKLESEFICMLNNDVIIEQDDFIDMCIDYFIEHPCAVIGPKIIRIDGTEQPLYGKLRSKEFYERVKKQLQIELFLLNKGIQIEKITKKITEIINGIILKRKATEKKEFLDYVLHGCCWIFTPQFVEKMSGLDERTFLYREEELLSIMLKKNNLHSRYFEKLKVLHYEDVSTNSLCNTKTEKRRFQIINEIKSLEIVISELERV